MPPLEHAESDEAYLAKLTALASQHADEDFRFMASVVTRLLAERVCESTESAFRAGMAKGEDSFDIAGTFSRAIVDELVGQKSVQPAAGTVVAQGRANDL